MSAVSVGSGIDYASCLILYVDDEAQSRKYFPKLFPQFRVLTAEGVREAQQIIAEHGDGLAIVISDQRMPDGSGTELLADLHRTRPDIIRILTTAYSDLDSAVAAVNRGAVYRYVLKPWERDDLRQTLMRACELFVLQRERNRLLREKMSVLQRMILMDRVRSFAVLAAGLATRVKHPMEALKAFLDAVPPPIDHATPGGEVNWNQLWDMARGESQRILDTVQGVVRRTLEPSYRFEPIDLAAIIREAAAPVAERLHLRGVTLVTEAPTEPLPAIRADASMIRQMVGILPERLAMVDPSATRIHIHCRPEMVWGQSGVRIAVTAEDSDWGSAQLSACFAMLSQGRPGPSTPDLDSGDLLAAYFIAYHHGGTLAVHRSTPRGPGFVAALPADPECVDIPGVDPQWIERTLTWVD